MYCPCDDDPALRGGLAQCYPCYEAEYGLTPPGLPVSRRVVKTTGYEEMVAHGAQPLFDIEDWCV